MSALGSQLMSADSISHKTGWGDKDGSGVETTLQYRPQLVQMKELMEILHISSCGKQAILVEILLKKHKQTEKSYTGLNKNKDVAAGQQSGH